MRWRRKHLRLREQALFVMGPQTFGSVEHVEVSWSAVIALTEASLSSNALRTGVSGTTLGYSLNRVGRSRAYDSFGPNQRNSAQQLQSSLRNALELRCPPRTRGSLS